MDRKLRTVCTAGKMDDLLSVFRQYRVTLIGSCLFGKQQPSDIDFMLSVPEFEIDHVEKTLLGLGFARNNVDPKCYDPLITSSFGRGMLDCQIATPENWEQKRKRLLKIKKNRSFVGKTKPELYQLYAESN